MTTPIISISPFMTTSFLLIDTLNCIYFLVYTLVNIMSSLSLRLSTNDGQMKHYCKYIKYLFILSFRLNLIPFSSSTPSLFYSISICPNLGIFNYIDYYISLLSLLTITLTSIPYSVYLIFHSFFNCTSISTFLEPFPLTIYTSFSNIPFPFNTTTSTAPSSIYRSNITFFLLILNFLCTLISDT